MTDPVPEITDLQNRIDEAELRQMAKAFPSSLAQDKEYGAQLAQSEAARNRLRLIAMAPKNIRQRSKLRLLTKGALWLTAISAWTA